MTITKDQVQQLAAGGGTAYTASDHDKVGQIQGVYLDNDTGDPEWLTVKTGRFKKAESFVPLKDASIDGDDALVNYSVKQVKGAPRIDPDGDLSPDDENQLYQYYGLDSATRQQAGQAAGDGQSDQGEDTSGPSSDDAMTRSEERMNVGTRRQESGRARLRKYVITENVTQTVPVSHEEVRVETEPITDENRDEAMSGPDISDEEHETVLHEERPTVQKETVPVERVRMQTENVSGQEDVSGQVRKEQIDQQADQGEGDQGQGDRGSEETSSS
jgi:uncharacterized protein (TIGR02271 family)